MTEIGIGHIILLNLVDTATSIATLAGLYYLAYRYFKKKKKERERQSEELKSEIKSNWDELKSEVKTTWQEITKACSEQFPEGFWSEVKENMLKSPPGYRRRLAILVDSQKRLSHQLEKLKIVCADSELKMIQAQKTEINSEIARIIAYCARDLLKEIKDTQKQLDYVEENLKDLKKEMDL